MKYIFATTAVLTAAFSALSAPVQAGILNQFLGKSAAQPVQAQVIPFTTFQAERQAAQKNLACKWISIPPAHQRSDFDFLCKGGTWATISYMLDRNKQDSSALGRARLVWRQWHPNAHPSGGEAHSVQPFLTHVLHHLVPANQAQDVEYAFWQTKNRTWENTDLKITYTHTPKADHNLHRLEIIGKAPKLGLATAQAQPARRAPTVQPKPQFTTPPQAPAQIKLPKPVPAQQKVKEPAYSPQNIKPPVAAPVQPKAPAYVAPAPTPTSKPKVRTSGQSSGRAVPAYQALPKPTSVAPAQSTAAIPTLKKQDKLDLGTDVNIPPPPSVFLPAKDPLKVVPKSTPALQQIKDAQLQAQPTRDVPLKNQLLQDYYRAENNTQRYRDRAEGSPTPLGEKIIEEELNPQPPQPVKPITH